MAVGAHFISLYFFIYVAPAPHPGGARAHRDMRSKTKVKTQNVCDYFERLGEPSLRLRWI